MKIFLSWSGETSHQIACTLRDWLPCVIQSIKPYVSSEDIDKGTRWAVDIARELQESSFGILCVTKDNIAAPWLNFEAGALSKSMETAFVVPLLFKIKPSDISGPLLQFQSVSSKKEDVLRLIETINNNASSTEQITQLQLTKTFEVWWPALETSLSEIDKSTDAVSPKTKQGNNSDAIEEVLQIVRQQQRILVSISENSANSDVIRGASSHELARHIDKISSVSRSLREILSSASAFVDREGNKEELKSTIESSLMRADVIFRETRVLNDYLAYINQQSMPSSRRVVRPASIITRQPGKNLSEDII